MKRNPKWGQENPIQQLRAILGSIEAELYNQIDGVASDSSHNRMELMLVWAKMIAEAIDKGDDPHHWS